MAAVCVIGGAGYVGIVTGVGLAALGHQVVNVDTDSERIEKLARGDCPIYEEGLEPVLRERLHAGWIRFSVDLPSAVSSSEMVFLATATPSLADGQVDLSDVFQASEVLARALVGYKVIAVKSTIPAGAVVEIENILDRGRREGTDFDIVINPEFLREGRGLQDFLRPERIVVGAATQRARELMRALYRPLIQGDSSRPGAVLIETDPATAVMIKYASNAFLATRISFINEVAGLCDRLGLTVDEVARGMGVDSRIGRRYLEAGLGFRGPCLEKDLRALLHTAHENQYATPLLQAVLDRNECQLGTVVTKVKHLTGGALSGKIVAVFGLAFKPGTNDVRNSGALDVIDRLLSEGAEVRAHDPIAILEARASKPQLNYCEDPYDAVDRADVLLVMTAWPSYRALDYRRIRDYMSTPCVVDTCNLLDSLALRRLGITYWGVGRP